MEAVCREYERLEKRQSSCAKKTLMSIDELILATENCRKKLAEGSADMDVDGAPPDTNNEGKKHLTELLKKVKSQKATPSHKEIYGMISKFSKSIDKNFQSEIETAADSEVFEEKQETLNEIIAEHFFRQGRFDIAEIFVQETGLAFDDHRKEPFLKMFYILESMKRKDLEPSLQWAHEHTHQLKEISSNFEFRIHRLKFGQLLLSQQPLEALLYAKRHISRFADTQLPEIKEMMGSLLFCSDLQNSRYSSFASDSQWTEVSNLFTEDCCRILGLSYQSPLGSSVAVGCEALPRMLKLTNVLKDKSGVWSQSDELPVEIELEDKHQHHSVFACPVSREISTRDNPPMILPCGHVIAKLSLIRLSKSSRFKCPYCPSEQSPSDAVEVFF